MASSRKQKEDALASYVDGLEESNGVVLADFRGLKVSEIEKLRRAATPIDGNILIVKNRIFKLALDKIGVTLPEECLIGPTLVGFCRGEVTPMAKMLVDAIKEYPTLELKGGLLGNSVLTIEQTKAIASLPPRDTLFAQVLGTINAPATQTAGVLASGIRQVINVVKAYADKLEEAGGGMAMGAAAEPA